MTTLSIPPQCIGRRAVARECVDRCISLGYFATLEDNGTLVCHDNDETLRLADELTAAANYFSGKNSGYHASAMLLLQDLVTVEYIAAGLTPGLEIEGWGKLTADQLRDALVYLADFQG